MIKLTRNMTQTKKNWFQTKIVDPLGALLKQGITPQKLALSFAIGLMVSTVPILFGVSMLICALLATFFKLNQVGIQIANYLAYPLQILLIIPYIKMGELLFRTQHVPLDFSSLKTQIQNAPKDFMMEKGSLLLQGFVAWAFLAPFVIGLLYSILLPLFKKMKILRKD